MTEKIVALGGDVAKIVECPLGVAPGGFPLTDRPPRPADDVVLIHTRHFKPVYNIEQLVEALPVVFRELPRARLMMLSDGALRPGVEKRVRTLGLAARVTFTGFLSSAATAAHLRDADVFVSTSRSDSVNISLLEAMASGCYPVVTDIAATRFWLGNGAGAARFVPVGDPAALAAAVVAAARDEEGRRRARAINRALVVRRGDIDVNMARVEKAFAALAAKGRELK